MIKNRQNMEESSSCDKLFDVVIPDYIRKLIKMNPEGAVKKQNNCKPIKDIVDEVEAEMQRAERMENAGNLSEAHDIYKTKLDELYRIIIESNGCLKEIVNSYPKLLDYYMVMTKKFGDPIKNKREGIFIIKATREEIESEEQYYERAVRIYKKARKIKEIYDMQIISNVTLLIGRLINTDFEYSFEKKIEHYDKIISIYDMLVEYNRQNGNIIDFDGGFLYDVMTTYGNKGIDMKTEFENSGSDNWKLKEKARECLFMSIQIYEIILEQNKIYWSNNFNTAINSANNLEDVGLALKICNDAKRIIGEEQVRICLRRMLLRVMPNVKNEMEAIKVYNELKSLRIPLNNASFVYFVQNIKNLEMQLEAYQSIKNNRDEFDDKAVRSVILFVDDQNIKIEAYNIAKERGIKDSAIFVDVVNYIDNQEIKKEAYELIDVDSLQEKELAYFLKQSIIKIEDQSIKADAFNKAMGINAINMEIFINAIKYIKDQKIKELAYERLNYLSDVLLGNTTARLATKMEYLILTKDKIRNVKIKKEATVAFNQVYSEFEKNMIIGMVKSADILKNISDQDAKKCVCSKILRTIWTNAKGSVVAPCYMEFFKTAVLTIEDKEFKKYIMKNILFAFRGNEEAVKAVHILERKCGVSVLREMGIFERKPQIVRYP